MLFALELILLGTGIWILISAKLPDGLFQFLFGKGSYHLPPPNARLWGLWLASPLPLSVIVSLFLAAMFGERSTWIAITFEMVYSFSVLISSIVIARKIREPLISEPGAPIPENASRAAPRSYGSRLLLISGLAVISFVTVIIIGTLIMTLFSTFAFGSTQTGQFSEDILPFITLFGLAGMGIFGTIKLIKLLRSEG